MAPRLKYEYLFWAVFIIINVLFIADRFTVNVWPRQWFATPDHGTGSDSMPIKEGPPSVKAYDIIARVSGRYTMSAFNALLITMMRSFHQFMYESWVGRNLIDFSDTTARVRIHICIGISIAVCTIVHVWSIIFPCIFNSYDLMVNPGTFTWPLSEDRPPGFKDVNNKTQLIMMQADDMYRLVLMTILLGPVLFLSYRWISSNYRVGMRLHQFIMIMYFIDIARRHTHPHSWVFNIPVFFLWILDLIVGNFYRHRKAEITRVSVSKDYILITWKDPNEKASTIADIYFMRNIDCCPGNGCCTLEQKHPFTSFNIRSNSLSDIDMICQNADQMLYLEDNTLCKRSSLADHLVSEKNPPKDDQDWSRAVLLRIYNGKYSHTKRMRSVESLKMDVWGPFRGELMSDKLRAHNCVFVGGGSGVGYLIDTILYLTHMTEAEAPFKKNILEDKLKLTNTSSRNISLVFSTNDFDLLRWFVSLVDDILDRNALPSDVNLQVKAALTSGNGAIHEVKAIKDGSIKFTWGSVSLGRCNFVEVIMETWKPINMIDKIHVFCQGSNSLQETVQKAARKTGSYFHPCHSFDNSKKSKNICCYPPDICV